ncbi:S8 family serine peptidase [Hymenobacter sp. BT491]|uniref:S8 family serine peptidase n=1 Tax=Hymenobacter sp. BT491 TaxID=2766779 RepID=UPI001653D033|nr:S8 family serine peptidase [Hymenobacter sp. BT491]MBC6990936.1 S8 family serine peptidase [Hymenobacter sp. BT491]
MPTAFMKQLYALLALCLLSATSLAQTVPEAPRLLVRLKEDTKPAYRQTVDYKGIVTLGIQAVDALNVAYKCQSISRLAQGNGPGVYSLTLPAGTSVEQAVQAYRASGQFEYVEPDQQGSGGGVQAVTPSDQLYNRQWGLKNNGSFSLSTAKAGADIKMEDAWAIQQGDSTVVVAIIDTGCKLDHPEFAGRIWKNRKEIPNNGLDDDRNGYVDDVQGWNFVSASNNPTDDYGHGTNVTGILGATGNNAIGYAGVDWNCKLMICKGLDDKNNGYYSWWISAIYYAVDNGARVINMSLGGVSNSQAMQDAVNYAYAHNVTVVACMMNTNTSSPYYPAALDHVLAVGSTNPDDTRTAPFFWDSSSGSNYGKHISVVAPGNYVYGLNHLNNTSYNTYWGGTSQATPHVAGLVSLLLAQNKTRTPAQLKALIEQTADDRVGAAAQDVTGWDQYYGYGRINAARALGYAVVTAATARRDAGELKLYPNPAHQMLTIQVGEAQQFRREYNLTNATGQTVLRGQLAGPETTIPLLLAPGLYQLLLPTEAGVLVRKLIVY